MLPEKQRRISRETLDIYAPLANALGIYQIKWELEDLAFRYLEPETYAKIEPGVEPEQRRARGLRQERHSRLCRRRWRSTASRSVGQGPVQAHLQHLSQDAEERSQPSEQIYDQLGIRILVPEVADCYAALGVVHTLWRPIQGSSTTTSPTPRRTSTSRCTRRCMDRKARLWRCRFAPPRWIALPTSASRRTGATRARIATTRRSNARSSGCAASSNGHRRTTRSPTTSWPPSRKICSRIGSTCSRPRASRSICRWARPRLTLPTRSTPRSGIAAGGPRSTASWSAWTISCRPASRWKSPRPSGAAVPAGTGSIRTWVISRPRVPRTRSGNGSASRIVN